MKTTMPIYASHKSSVGGFSANTLSIFIYIGVFLISLIPYAQYLVWVFPLYFLLKEKDSELVKFSAAQCIVIYAISAAVNFVLTFFSALFSTASSGVIGAIMNISKATFPSALYIISFLILAYLTFTAAKNAQEYVAYRFKFIDNIADKLAAL